MDLSNLLQLLRRQWWVVGLVLAVAVATAYGTWNGASPTYRTEATLAVLPPLVDVEGDQRNPYLDIASASNADIAQRLSIQINGASWRSRLTQQGASRDYLVDHGDGRSPILRVQVETDTASQAEATLEAVMGALTEELDTQQDRFELDDQAKFTIDVLDRSSEAARLYGNRSRFTGAVLLLGLAAAVTAAHLVDRLKERSNRRKQSLVTTSSDELDDPPVAKPSDDPDQPHEPEPSTVKDLDRPSELAHPYYTTRPDLTDSHSDGEGGYGAADYGAGARPVADPDTVA